MANNGNVQRRHKKFKKPVGAASAADARCAPRNSASKLFRNVMAIMGKLVDSVNTGNNVRKYSVSTSITSDCFDVGMKFSVYKSSSEANANDPVIANNR